MCRALVVDFGESREATLPAADAQSVDRTERGLAATLGRGLRFPQRGQSPSLEELRTKRLPPRRRRERRWATWSQSLAVAESLATVPMARVGREDTGTRKGGGTSTIGEPMRPNDEREILERTVQAIAQRARDAYRVVEEAHAVDPRDESGLVAAAKRRGWNSSRRRPSWSGNSRMSTSAVDATGGCIGFPGSGRSRAIGDMRSRRLKATSRSSAETEGLSFRASPPSGKSSAGNREVFVCGAYERTHPILRSTSSDAI
jgi:hypothetical protein